MRIIGGKFSGRRIIAPKGLVSRPTTDRVRESLFSILEARDDINFDGARVIDLFAGSGALGLEAMSRGAAWCLFVETDAGARGAIRDNIEALALFGATRLHRRSAAALGERPANIAGAFSIAFMDPPYEQDLWGPALGTLAQGGWLSSGAHVVIEQSAREAHAEHPQFEFLDNRRYGDTQITILQASGTN